MKNITIKITVLILVTLSMTILSSCRIPGFSEPILMDTDIPDGTVEYKAGWRSGCRSGLSADKRNVQGWVYDADHGTGAYQQHPDFYDGWSHGWFNCVIHVVTFIGRPAMQYGPLE